MKLFGMFFLKVKLATAKEKPADDPYCQTEHYNG